jgi:hypothetical protein
MAKKLIQKCLSFTKKTPFLVLVFLTLILAKMSRREIKKTLVICKKRSQAIVFLSQVLELNQKSKSFNQNKKLCSLQHSIQHSAIVQFEKICNLKVLWEQNTHTHTHTFRSKRMWLFLNCTFNWRVYNN